MASFRTTLQLPRALAPSSRIRINPPYGVATRLSPICRHSSTSTPTRPCPSCNTPISIPASPCPNCSKIVPIPTGITHHSILHLSEPIASTEANTTFDIPSELLDLPAYGFDLDVKGLRGKMLRRQMELHPDKYSGDDKAVSLARDLSGRVNGAYEVLRDPLKRAEYLVCPPAPLPLPREREPN
jgi:molecular chaperone HscB